MTIKAILFDLGGVLIHLDGPPIKSDWLSSPITDKQSWALWSNSKYVKAFEQGRISVDEFARGVVKENSLLISSKQFTKYFIQWPTALFPGSLELLGSIRKNYTLALFSNTSELHWPRIMGEMKLQGKFDHYFASFQINMFKPDVDSFHYVAEKMSLKPEQILFLDDNSRNVSAAHQAGMQSDQVKGIDEVVKALGNRNLSF